jgi:hypothetical protein
VRQYLLLLQDFDLVLLFDNATVHLLLVGEVRKFEFVADQPALEFLWEGLVFKGLSPDTFLRVATGETELATFYVGLLDSFLCWFLVFSILRLLSDFIELIKSKLKNYNGRRAIPDKW